MATIDDLEKEQKRQAREQTSMMKEIIALHECKGELIETLGEYRQAVEKNERSVETLSATLDKLNDSMEAFIDAKRSIRWMRGVLVYVASIAGSIYAIILLLTNEAFKKITGLFGG